MKERKDDTEQDFKRCGGEQDVKKERIKKKERERERDEKKRARKTKPCRK